MKAKNPEAWKQVLELNRGPYEAVILGFAERWADRMEARMEWGAKLEDIAEETIDQDKEGIRLANFRLAQAIAALIKHWVHGEALKAWREANWKAVRARREG